VGLVIGMKS